MTKCTTFCYAEDMSVQIAVKLPDRLVDEIDALVADGAFASRSDAVRHGIEALVRADERRRIDLAFTEGFLRMPERDEEMEDATRLAVESIHDEPWDKWW
jgi:Arc/MetJ-type ribon-helix-helix transcriptional regulator